MDTHIALEVTGLRDTGDIGKALAHDTREKRACDGVVLQDQHSDGHAQDLQMAVADKGCVAARLAPEDSARARPSASARALRW